VGAGLEVVQADDFVTPANCRLLCCKPWRFQSRVRIF
jgi:hypothetical protein